MFELDEIRGVQNSVGFLSDYGAVRETLVSELVQGKFDFDRDAANRLLRYVNCTLASASSWNLSESEDVLGMAAETAEALATSGVFSEATSSKIRFWASLLYELAGLPALSSAVLEEGDSPPYLRNLLERYGPFQTLATDYQPRFPKRNGHLIDWVLDTEISFLESFEQGHREWPSFTGTKAASVFAHEFSTALTVTEIDAIKTVLQKRLESATRSLVREELFERAIDIGFPPELWRSQVAAIEGGIIDTKFDSWGFAAPTGTGKTFLTRLLILDALVRDPAAKIVYVVPSRALVHEVAKDLAEVFAPLSYDVVAVSPQLVELGNDETESIESVSVAVLTPEKADMLLRMGTEFLRTAKLVIVDEAHHIEASTRGVLLELYLWRIRKTLGSSARVIFLSAVAKNIGQLANWMGQRPGSISLNRRPTRMRVGVFRKGKDGHRNIGRIDYSDGASRVVIDKERLEPTHRAGIAQLAIRLQGKNTVLVVAKGKKECETLARTTCDRLTASGLARPLTEAELQSDVIQRLDSRLARELYDTVEMRALIKNRVVYHHAGLPPRVRIAVEAAIRGKLIDYVFATTTLAEGVNFPFSTVIVQALALRDRPERGRPARYTQITPRTFWNIAGRAGRPGFDREGQVILYEPSLGLERVNAVIESYTDPDVSTIEPVRSALAEGLRNISEAIDRGEVTRSDLDSAILPSSLPRSIQGTINLLRVGIIHAKAEDLIKAPEEILEGSFARQMMDRSTAEFSKDLFTSQGELIDDFLRDKDSITIDAAAELGLSLSTLTALRDYVAQLDNWKLEAMGKVMLGGQVNFGQVDYVIRPVTSRMAELEGPTLGSLYSEIISQWLRGIPLSQVTTIGMNSISRLEDLVSVIYSRIQYLLPWGLYAMDRIVASECDRRSISYDHEVQSLAYLADAGVPNFDALRLVGYDFERVDATRLALQFRSAGGFDLGVDVVGWIKRYPLHQIERVIKGIDQRYLDYDLFKVLQAMGHKDL